MTVQYWTWWLIAVALAGLEMVVPGASLLWIGVAAAAVGLVLLAFPDLALSTQLLIFSVGVVASIIGVRLWLRSRFRDGDDGERAGEDHPHLNRRAEQYIGTVHRLDSPIVNGRGRARVEDGSWAVEGPDLPAGVNVRVIGAQGAVLKVEKAE